MDFKKFLIIVFLFLPTALLSQSVEIRNVYFEPKGDEVIIYYDLSGDQFEDYEIEVFLKVENDKNFNYKLKYVSGDVGVGKYVGGQRKIVWNIGKEFPIGLEGDQYYFEVTVDEIGSGIAWYYYVGAAVVGGTAAVLLTSGKSSDDPSALKIPIPPIRPDN